MRDDTHSLKSLLSRDTGKFKNKSTELKTIFTYLKDHVATATMVSHATGVPRPNITRYKRDLELSGLLTETEKKYCKITNHLAWYLSTNPELFPKSNQLNIF